MNPALRTLLALLLAASSWSSVMAATPAAPDAAVSEAPAAVAPVTATDPAALLADTAAAGTGSNDASSASAVQASVAAPASSTAPRVRLDATQDAPRGDLWQRIRNGFVLPDLKGDRVRAWERYYAGKPDYVQRMTARGSRYLFHIVEEVEKRGMPLELALLPFAESAFNPQAMSSAKASGMWQFMPATGKDFSLRQNLFRDDRRDVLASTRAALDYLQRLHKMMGDWHLALAAYNWGQGNVQRAISVNRSQGKSISFESLQMPDETRNYVPKLQAIKNYVLSPDALGMQLPALEDHPYFRSVSIDRDIDVAKAADLAGLSLEEFQALNPQMNKPLILAAGTPQVLLPYDNANRFLQEMQQTRAPLATWTAWVAPSTLTPADAARLVGMSEELLREVNRIPERMLVKAGSTLLVPRGIKTQSDVASHVADNATMTLTPEARPMRRVSFKAGRKGESVASVAARHGVSPSALASWNKMPVSGQFKAGQPVVVMLPVLAARASAGRMVAAASAAPEARQASRPSAKTVRGADRKVLARSPSLAKVTSQGKNKNAVTVAARRDVPAKLRVRGTVAKSRAAPRRA